MESVELVPIGNIIPAKFNDRLYRPVNPSDPAIKALGESIRGRGLLEPIVVTLDNPAVVVSGHRRLAGCKLAELKKVPPGRFIPGNGQVVDPA